MKKLILLTIALLAFNSAFSQTLKGKITYRAAIVDSHVNYDMRAPAPVKILEMKSGKDAIPINFHLFFTGNESLYKAENDMETDQTLGLLMNQTRFVGRSDMVYYVNMKTKEKYYESYFTQGILVNIDDIHWELTKETKKIGKYTCYKATATIDSEQSFGMGFIKPVIAWYTPDIPVPFGIQTFVGLPGLTLELIVDYQEAIIQYIVAKIELDPKEEIVFEKSKGKKYMSEQEYHEHLKKLKAGISKRY